MREEIAGRIPNGHILVVDDEPQNVHFLSDLLPEQGYRVSTAESGVRALEIGQ